MLYPFAYAAPAGKADLLRLLDAERDQVRLLAGGTDLLVELRQGRSVPKRVLDLKRATGFDRITYDSREGLRIGPAVTCAELLQSTAVREHYPVLTAAAALLGSPQLRNRATVAGNLCTASPCADMGTALLAHAAEVELESQRGTRLLPLAGFFVGVKKTALRRDEILSAVLVPADQAGARGGMEKLKRVRGHDLALCSVALVRKADRMRVAVGACAPTPVVTPELSADASIEDVLAAVRAVIRPIDDLRASAEYRQFMVETFVGRLVGAASVEGRA
jgi:CO/xanthine dehydrogenase FAD-binding subunit